jgi:hypothetical protein
MGNSPTRAALPGMTQKTSSKNFNAIELLVKDSCTEVKKNLTTSFERWIGINRAAMIDNCALALVHKSAFFASFGRPELWWRIRWTPRLRRPQCARLGTSSKIWVIHGPSGRSVWSIRFWSPIILFSSILKFTPRNDLTVNRFIWTTWQKVSVCIF